MADLVRAFGDTEEPFRFQLLKRVSEISTEVVDLTGKMIALSIRSTPGAANLSEFDSLDITGGIVVAIEGTIDHVLTAPQAAQLVAGDWVAQVQTDDGGGGFQTYPNDPVVFKEFFEIHVAPSFF